MLPLINIGDTTLPTFALSAAIGLMVFFLYIIAKVKNSQDIYYILPKVCLALGVGYVGAIFFDALFKIPQNNAFKIEGMTFYGGLVSGGIALIILLLVFKKNRKKSIMEWLDLLIVPFVIFHMFGRIGCFLGGCCYGDVTDSIFGVHFPDNPDANIYHYGQKVIPTQLIEAVALLILAVSLMLIKKRKFIIYCYAYPVCRFLIEFLRADNRGVGLWFMSPAQVISVLIIIAITTYLILTYIKRKKESLQN